MPRDRIDRRARGPRGDTLPAGDSDNAEHARGARGVFPGLVVEAFLKKYADNPLYAALAKDKLKAMSKAEVTALENEKSAEAGNASNPEQTASPSKTVDFYVDPGDGTSIGPDVSISDFQAELKRLGCFDTAVDGDWGQRSKASLASFKKYAKADLDVDTLDRSLLDALKSTHGTVCPSSCETGMTLQNGDCRKIVCASGSKLKDGLCEPKPASPLVRVRKSTSRERMHRNNCFSLDGQKFCE